MCVALATKVARHESGEKHNDALRQRGKETKTAERRTEEEKLDAGEKRSNRRVDHIAPVEVAGVVESEELVAVEAVLVIEESVEKDVGKSEEGYPGEGAAVVAMIDWFRW